MKTLEEIFKTNKALLKEPEVIELTKEFAKQYNTLKIEKFNYWDKVTNITMHSELFVIDGIDSKEALKKIHETSF